jgi:adenosine kinase
VAEKYDLDYISSPTIAPLIDGAKAFYVEGYFLTHGTNIIVELGKKVSNAGKVCPWTTALTPDSDRRR